MNLFSARRSLSAIRYAAALHNALQEYPSLLTRLLTLAASGLLLLPVAARRVLNPDEVEIRAARAEQNAAIAARDLDRVASFWFADVQVTAGLGFAFHGREFYRRAFALDSVITYRRDPENVVVSSHWPLAVETGTWTGRLKDVSGPPAISGRYSAQWVKLEGRWLIRSELFVALNCAGSACAWPARPQ
jgi:ketosteroid isomerase-like protein